jgi:uncharacterized protein YndB with AHSA1/START domain
MIDTSLFVAPGPDQRLLAWQVRLNADPAEVFRTWTTAEGLGALLDAEARVELRIGGPIEVFFMPDAPEGSRGSEGCQFLAYVPDRMLAFSWNAPPSIPETRNLHTWVVMEFDAAGEGSTDLTLTHLGFGEGDAWDETHAYFVRAWGMVIDAMVARFGS